MIGGINLGRLAREDFDFGGLQGVISPDFRRLPLALPVRPIEPVIPIQTLPPPLPLIPINGIPTPPVILPVIVDDNQTNNETIEGESVFNVASGPVVPDNVLPVPAGATLSTAPPTFVTATQSNSSNTLIAVALISAALIVFITRR